jgi:hypothetical protein
MALALAGAAAIGIAGTAAPAYAKDKGKDKAEEQSAAGKPQYTKAFVDAYKPLEDAFNGAKDAAAAEAARPLVAPVLAAIANDDDKYAAGSLVLQLGLKLSDKELQEKGLTLQLESGKVPQDRQAVFNYYVGGFEWDKQNYAAAQPYLTKAYDLGYRENDVEWLVAESYFQQKQNAQGLAQLKRMEQAREAAGSALSEKALRSGLKAAYDSKDTAQIADLAALVAAHYPSPDTWNTMLAVVRDSYTLQADEVLDLFRLMRLTKSLKTKQDYVYYVDAADPRRLPNEVAPVLQEGISKGLLDTKDAYVSENLQVAQSHAADDRASADQIAKEAQSAANGVSARAAGDNYLAIGEPQKAEAMYKLAGQKGGVEADRLAMRTGIAQTYAGELADARQSFQQVTGARAPVARMWLAYLDSTKAPAANQTAAQ